MKLSLFSPIRKDVSELEDRYMATGAGYKDKHNILKTHISAIKG